MKQRGVVLHCRRQILILIRRYNRCRVTPGKQKLQNTDSLTQEDSHREPTHFDKNVKSHDRIVEMLEISQSLILFSEKYYGVIESSHQTYLRPQ